MRRFAFEEQDAPVIEAQQRIIDASRQEVDPLTLAIDVGPVRYKQVLKKLIAAEQASLAGSRAPPSSIQPFHGSGMRRRNYRNPLPVEKPPHRPR